jgi:hypothetical protein
VEWLDWIAALVREAAMQRTSSTEAKKILSWRSLPKPVKPANPASIVAALQADREE